MHLETIKKRSDFLKASKKGKHVATKGLVLQAVRRGDVNGTRFGFTISKKVDKKAVVRNRIKRKFREAVKKAGKTLLKPDLDYVIIGRKSSLKRKLPELVKDLKYALHQINK